jgi:protein-tyrosine phosphatase
MIVRPYWIKPRIGIIPRPRGRHWLDPEMQAIAAAGVNVVVSLLPESEAEELGLEREEEAAVRAGLRFFSFPIEDREVPDNLEQFNELLANLVELMAAGQRIGVHCRACIGRSSVLATSLLIRTGIPAATAWRRVELAREFPVPDTKEQREWVDKNIHPTG